LPGLEGASVEIIYTIGIKAVENFESDRKTAEIFDKLSRSGHCDSVKEWVPKPISGIVVTFIEIGEEKPWEGSIPAGSFECGIC